MKIPLLFIEIAGFILSIISLIITIIFMANNSLEPVWGTLIIITLGGAIIYMSYRRYIII